MSNVVSSYWSIWIVVHSIIIFLNRDITYRIFFFSNVFIVSAILLFICNIKILILIVSPLNESECTVLKVITFVLIDMSVIFIMSSRLSLVNPIVPGFTSIFMSPLITSYCSVTSSSSVSLSPESPSDSFSTENELFEILDSSLLESISSSPIIPSR